MTVCVAALCRSPRDPWVIGACDRMLTSEIQSLEYEPPRSKLRWLHRSLVAMEAGDTSIQTAILDKLSKKIAARRNPDQSPSVKVVAEAYGRIAIADRQARAEAEVLSPLGLTQQSFLRQTTLKTALVLDIQRQLAQFAFDFAGSVECIFAGVDQGGAHVYVGWPGVPYCHDSVGYAAIGSGGRHADSYLMLEKHTPDVDWGAAMFSVYSAKKRGESAPGVGVATDMFVIGPDGIRGVSGSDSDSKMVKDLDKFYRQERRAAINAAIRARKRMGDYFDQVVRGQGTSDGPTPSSQPGFDREAQQSPQRSKGDS